MTRAQFDARILELIAKGYTSKAADRTARKERRRAHPQHRAAIARRLALADARFERTGNPDAYTAQAVQP